jgi:YNFM family putative membrane transporter
LEKLDKTTVATMLAGMCTFLNVYCTQPLLPLLRETFHASELEVSLTVSATILATALAAPIIGMIAERRGRKKVIVPSLFMLTIPTVLAATSTSLRALIFWRFAQGLFVPGVIAVMLAYVNEEWAGRSVGRAMSSYVTGTVIGGFLGRFISGVIATHWRWLYTFPVLGAINLMGAVVVRAWLPPEKNFVRVEHLQLVLDHAKEHLRNPRLLANFGMGATMLFALVGCFTYANFYLAAAPFRLNSAQLGSIFFVYLLGVVITPQSGRFLDHFGFRHTTVLHCIMMIAGLLLTLLKSLPMVIVGLAIFSSGVFAAQAAATVQTGAILPDWFWRRERWPGCVALLRGVSLASLWLARISSRPLDQAKRYGNSILGYQVRSS